MFQASSISSTLKKKQNKKPPPHKQSSRSLPQQKNHFPKLMNPCPMPSVTPLATAGKNLILTNLVCKAFRFLCGLQTLLHTHTRIILTPISFLQRLQITFHGRRAVLGTRPTERKTHRTNFQAEGKARQKRQRKK